MKNKLNYLIPIFVVFFTMGFVDLVGIATNYIKDDFQLSDTFANFLPSMVFFWFFVCSVPTGMLMNKIGRRNTVLLSLLITALALAIPIFAYNFTIMLVSFSLLGIGNALMQVSINPFVSNVVANEYLASTLTFGQFVKAIASFSAPLIAGWAAVSLGNWRVLFPLFMAIAVLASLILFWTKIPEKKPDASSSFIRCIALLKEPFILFSFIGIICHVGIDVGTNVTAPKLLRANGFSMEEAGVATMMYFIFRTLGCFIGSFMLSRIKNKIFWGISAGLILIGMLGLMWVSDYYAILTFVALIGLGNANIFPIIFSQAMICKPEKENEVSGLMIMGLIGGTIFPLLMGVTSDLMGSQTGAIIVMCVGVIYLLYYISGVKNEVVSK